MSIRFPRVLTAATLSAAPKPLGPVRQTVLTGVDGGKAVLFPRNI